MHGKDFRALLFDVFGTVVDWRSSVISDGFVMLRHPDLDATLHMADRVATDLQLYAA